MRHTQMCFNIQSEWEKKSEKELSTRIQVVFQAATICEDILT